MKNPAKLKSIRLMGKDISLPTKPFDITQVTDIFTLFDEMQRSGGGYSYIYFKYVVYKCDIESFLRNLKEMPLWNEIRERVFSQHSPEDFVTFIETESSNFPLVPFTDNYLFQSVLNDERICQLFIEKVLGHAVKICGHHIEYVIQATRAMHGVRLDVCVELEDGTLVDVEMQVASQKFLRQRLAAYRAGLVFDQLYKTAVGDKVVYNKIRPVIVIFICDFAPDCVGDRTITYFDVVTRHDKELAKPYLGTDVVINLLGTNNDGLDKYLDEFRRAIVSNGNASFSGDNELVSLFNKKAKDIQQNQEWRLRKMSLNFFETDIYNKGYDDCKEKMLVCLLKQKASNYSYLANASGMTLPMIAQKAKELGVYESKLDK